MMNTIQPLRRLTAGLLLMGALTQSAPALTLPVSEDSSTAASLALAKAAGKATSLSVTGTNKSALVRFDVGALSTSLTTDRVASASLTLYVNSATKAGDLTLHLVTQDWSETGAAGAFSPTVNPAPLALIPSNAVVAKQFIIIDVTATVKGWLNSPGTDFGFSVAGTNTVKVLLGSKEGVALGYAATLEIVETEPWQVSGSNVSVTNSSVGIGTTAPAKALDVTGTAAPVGSGDSVESSVLVRVSNAAFDGNISNPNVVGIGFGHDSTRQAIVGGTFGNDFLDFYTGGLLTSPKMRINFGGDVGIGTNAPAAKLHVIGNILASGTITPNSDRNMKTDFAPVDAAAVLDKVARLPIQQWRFKAEPDEVKHFGPMAQDFRAAFGLGQIPTAIATVDADGVALAAIQGLNQKVEERSKKLEAENAELTKSVAELKRVVEQLLQKGSGR